MSIYSLQRTMFYVDVTIQDPSSFVIVFLLSIFKKFFYFQEKSTFKTPRVSSYVYDVVDSLSILSLRIEWLVIPWMLSCSLSLPFPSTSLTCAVNKGKCTQRQVDTEFQALLSYTSRSRDSSEEGYVVNLVGLERHRVVWTAPKERNDWLECLLSTAGRIK